MDESIAVYVPTAVGNPPHGILIAPKSGVVGTPARDRVLIDFEGNLYGAVNIVTFGDRVNHAWGRHSTRYPTVARLSVPKEAVTQVGQFWPSTGTVAVWPTMGDVLEAWLELSPIPEEELRVTHGRRAA